MAGAEEWDEFLAGLTTQLTDVPDDDPSFFNWRTAARSAIEVSSVCLCYLFPPPPHTHHDPQVEVFDDAPDAKRARNDSQEMDEFAGEFVTGCGTGTGSGEERGAHAGSGDTTEESGPEGEGLTHAEVQEHVDALSSCCDGAAAFQDGYSLFCTGVAEGRRVLSASLLRSLDLSKTRVVDFANYEANADLFMQCAFELNGCRGVRFTWEEESQQTKGGFMPYKSVVWFSLFTLSLHSNCTPVAGSVCHRREGGLEPVGRREPACLGDRRGPSVDERAASCTRRTTPLLEKRRSAQHSVVRRLSLCAASGPLLERLSAKVALAEQKGGGVRPVVSTTLVGGSRCGGEGGFRDAAAGAACVDGPTGASLLHAADLFGEQQLSADQRTVATQRAPCPVQRGGRH